MSPTSQNSTVVFFTLTKIFKHICPDECNLWHISALRANAHNRINRPFGNILTNLFSSDIFNPYENIFSYPILSRKLRKITFYQPYELKLPLFQNKSDLSIQKPSVF